MKAGELCTRTVVLAHPEEAVQAAAARMRDEHVGTLLVVERAACGPSPPVGIVTDRDLVRGVLAPARDPKATRVDDVMTRQLVTVGEEDDVAVVLRRMKQAGVRRVPVVGARGELHGILSYDDLLEWVVEEMSALVAVVDREQWREREASQPR